MLDIDRTVSGWATLAVAVTLAPKSLAVSQPLTGLVPMEVVQRLQSLPDWGLDGQTLVTSCEFADFTSTVEFVSQLVAPAEQLGHHPDLVISYSQLVIRLTTHDEGGVTELDLALAAEISALARGRCRRP